MKRINFTKFFSTFLALVMVLSLLLPTAPVSAAKSDAFKTDRQTESIMQQKLAIAEQLKLAEQEPRLHESLKKLKGSQEVDVIIHLSEKPAALEKGIKEVSGKKFTASDNRSARAKVASQHGMMKRAMNANKISFKEKFSYDTVLNGIAATVKADDLEKLINIKGVTLIEPDVEVHASEDLSATGNGKVDIAMDTSNSFLGIEPLWAEGYEGQGIKVAVLDTGIDADHPDFAGIYKGGKNFIPNSSTYTKERADDDASETLPSERPEGTPEFNANGSSFYTSHGTHVAGTIAAIGNNEFGIKGIAPKVDLYAYRVLGAYGSGSTSGIIAAIEESVLQEMDVINLSLGGGSNTETDAGSYAINNAMLAGVISVVATGNSGPNRGTMGTPSTAPFGIAVGNTTNPETMYDVNVSVEAGDYQLSSQLNLMATTYGTNLEEQLAGEFDLVAVPGIGGVSDFEGIDVEGKVALIARGEIPFVEKIENARANGAVATIIHNSHNGSNSPDISDVFLGDDFAFLPTVDMSYTDGTAIRAALQLSNGTVTFTNVNATTTEGDEVNDSSSRGPSVPNFDIKPDVSAPGTNILSTIPMYKADFPDATYEHAFARKTGTSMATPHVAGIAALVKQANPDWNAFDVKVALSNTAKILDTDKYDVFAQGAGRVDAYAAAHANVLAYAVDRALPNEDSEAIENLKGTVTFGPQSLEEDITVSKEILVKDLNNVGGDYEVSVDVTKRFADASVSVDKSSFTLNGEEVITVTLTASQNSNTKPGDEILGYIHINGENSNLSLPFAADFGGVEPATIKDMSISETDLSFDGDGYKDSALLGFTLTGDVQTNYIEIWDIMNPGGGAYGDGYIGYLHASASLGAGSYTLNIAGQYYPWSGEPATTIPDGLYTIDFTGLTEAGVIGDYVGPIVVKSSAGSIESAVEGTSVTGKIVDKYVDYQTELVKYGLGFDINTKLTATSEVTKDGETVTTPITLQQDGSFTFDFGNDNPESVVVKYVDAAGNAAEKVVFEGVEEPEEPEEPEVPGDDATYTVPAEEIESQLDNKKAKEVTVSVPQFEEAVNVEIDGALVKALKDSKKDLVIESEEISFTLARKVVEKLDKGTNDTLTIVLTKEASTNAKAISDVYSFHFATGEDLKEINIGKEKIDVTLAVDVSNVGKTNQLWGEELNTGKTHKAKYDKKTDTATFKSDGPGTYVVIDRN
ncbi:S8 family serine peptidase [Oceanobacillus sp. CAU 1775]